MASWAPATVRRYTGLGLLPQDGIVVVLALLVQGNPAFSGVSSWFMSTIIGATVVHEFIGPIAVKAGLLRAKEEFKAREAQSGEARAAVSSPRDYPDVRELSLSETLHSHTVYELEDKLFSAVTVSEVA